MINNKNIDDTNLDLEFIQIAEKSLMKVLNRSVV